MKSLSHCAGPRRGISPILPILKSCRKGRRTGPSASRRNPESRLNPEAAIPLRDRAGLSPRQGTDFFFGPSALDPMDPRSDQSASGFTRPLGSSLSAQRMERGGRPERGGNHSASNRQLGVRAGKQGTLARMIGPSCRMPRSIAWHLRVTPRLRVQTSGRRCFRYAKQSRWPLGSGGLGVGPFAPRPSRLSSGARSMRLAPTFSLRLLVSFLTAPSLRRRAPCPVCRVCLRILRETGGKGRAKQVKIKQEK